MSIVSPLQKQALLYFSNAEKNATLERFIEDLDPIGQVIWDDLEAEGLVGKDANGKLILTNKGQQIVGGER